jgi:hypothetical protein
MITIQTNVNETFHPEMNKLEYDALVREKADYIIKRTEDAYYTYKSLMLWVAEQTKSVVSSDEINNIYSFTYVGI